MKYTEEQAREVLNDFKECVGENCLNAVDTWLNTKYLKLPETGLVVGDGGDAYIMRTGRSSGYGFRYIGSKDGFVFELSDDWSFESDPDEWDRPATKEDEERWKELLIEEVKRRGYKKGVVINEFHVGRRIIKSNDYRVKYYKNEGIWCVRVEGWSVFENGKWAEIIEDEKPTKDEVKKAMITLQKYLEL